jgi:iron complex outermembrane receptor protein
MLILRAAAALAVEFFLVLPARAQVQLPEIVVTAPSPIVRRPAVPAEQVTSPAPETPLQGTLPIVTDQFATVTVVPNEELRRSTGATLGDLLFSKPGITGSSFAPGASSRPIIRGLDVNRVGILENGVGGGGASDLGEDHFVPIDPLATNQVEVIRGPATLRYGSQSIGGVVSATNNRIPDALPQRGVTTELRGNTTAVNAGLDGAVLLDAGHGNFAFHADAFGRRASDYGIPSYPYLFDPARPFNGRQPNSSLRSDGMSVGGSYIFDRGFFGVAVSQTNALYHIPGIDGEDHNTRIDARQTKLNSKGEFRPDSSMIDAIRFWLGATDYKHSELGFLDPADPSTDGVRQVFTNREQEGRIEVQFMPLNLRFAALTTALGVQAGHQQLTAPSPDNPGLWDPNRNTRVAGYIFNEFKFTETLKAQVAGRIEKVSLNGITRDFPADFLPNGNPLVSTQRAPEFTPKSVSFGVIKNLPWDLAVSLTVQRVERAPKPAELFSRGAHDATTTFDIGNPNLNIEVANSIEAGLRRATGPIRFEATAYYTKFDGFIFRRLTGVMCDSTFDTCGNPAGGLKQAVYSQRDAIFRGGEFQSQWDVAPLWAGVFGLESQFDIVRATSTDGTNVPRIPPMRVGGGVFYRDGNWLARVNLLHAFAQNDVSAVETPTPGYNLLKAEISYTRKIKEAGVGIYELTLGMTADNLLNDDIRNSVSFTKDEVLMPGRNIRLFANVRF